MRTITPVVDPILLAGLQKNVEIVCENIIKPSVVLIGRGDILPVLAPSLTLEDAPILASNVAKLLGALGTSPAASLSLRLRLSRPWLRRLSIHPASKKYIYTAKKKS